MIETAPCVAVADGRTGPRVPAAVPGGLVSPPADTAIAALDAAARATG